MLVGPGLAVFVLRVVVCEYYDEYEYFEGYHDDSYGDYFEDSPSFGPGSDTGRVRRFGDVPETPHTRNYDDIKGALQKIMPGHAELFQGLTQPQVVTEKAQTETSDASLSQQFDAPSQYDSTSLHQDYTISHREVDTTTLHQNDITSPREDDTTTLDQNNTTSPRQGDTVSPRLFGTLTRQYGVYEEITPTTAPQSLETETEAVIYRLTLEDRIVTPLTLNNYVEQSTQQDTSTAMMRTTYAPEISLTYVPVMFTDISLRKALTHALFTTLAHVAVRSTIHGPMRSSTQMIVGLTSHERMRSTKLVPVRSTTHKPVSSTYESVRLTTHMPVQSTTYVPMRSITHVPVRLTTHVPVRSTTHVPVPLTTHMPVQSTTHVPVRSTKHVPVRLTTHVPLRSTTHLPVRSTMHVPVRSTTYVPTRSITHVPVRLTTHVPVRSTTHVPVPLTTHAPARSKNRKPTRSTARIPVTSTTLKPIRSRTQKPVRLHNRKPTRSTTLKPIKSRTQKPVRFHNRKPTRSTTLKPIKTKTQEPVRSQNRKPTRSTTLKPIRSKTHKPLRSRNRKPTRSTTRKPIRLKLFRKMGRVQTTSSSSATVTSSPAIDMDIQTYDDYNKKFLGNSMMMDTNIYNEYNEIPYIQYKELIVPQRSKPNITNILRQDITTAASNPETTAAANSNAKTTTAANSNAKTTTAANSGAETTTAANSNAKTTTAANSGAETTTAANSNAKTTTAAGNTTTIRTSTYLAFDIESFLEILANLTYDYDTNLTLVMNMTLRNNTPTCLPESMYFLKNVTTTTSTTTPVYEAPVSINNTVIAKCFVCGLKSPGIPYDSSCADAFAGDFLPLTPIDPLAKAKTSSFRKYCRFGEIYNFHENVTRPRSIYGRWTGGCSVRWTDLSGLYTQRSCRNRKRATTGLHFASKRMAKLEMALGHTEDGCIISPVATLLPLSRGISLYSRIHACVCTGNWCNEAAHALPSALAVVAPAALWLYF